MSVSRRRLISFIVAGMAALGGGLAWQWQKPASAAAPPREQVKWVTLTPPEMKPIATPPPLEQPPEQKSVEPKQVLDAEPVPAAAKPQPVAVADEPPAAMGTNITGADGSLAIGGIGDRAGPGGRGKRGGNLYSGLASQIQRRIETALRQDKRTRDGSYRERVKLWLDASGTVTRAESERGDKSLTPTVLFGVKILDGTPAGMPMPIQTSISSVRPQ